MKIAKNLNGNGELIRNAEDLSKLEEKKQIELAELIYKRLEREGEIINEKMTLVYYEKETNYDA